MTPWRPNRWPSAGASKSIQSGFVSGSPQRPADAVPGAAVANAATARAIRSTFFISLGGRFVVAALSPGALRKPEPGRRQPLDGGGQIRLGLGHGGAGRRYPSRSAATTASAARR